MTRTGTLGVAALAGFACLGLGAQEPDQVRTRYKIEFNAVAYPQKTPQEALKSIVKAFDGNQYHYLMAHLVDPRFVDVRVAEYKGLMFPPDSLRKEDEEISREVDAKRRKRLETEKEIREAARFAAAFNRMADEAKKHHDEDPPLRRELRIMARDGEWAVEGDRANVSLPKLTPRKAFFKKLEDRWFMDEKNQ